MQKKNINSPSIVGLLVVLLATSCSLRVLGFARTAKLVRKHAAGRAPMPLSYEQMELLAKRVAIAGALFPGRARCLEQAMVVFYHLGRRTNGVVLRVGVQPHGFRSHAWVEVAGRPLNDHDDSVRSVVPILEFGQ